MKLPATPKLVFICGTPRSGGAVTHASFDRHPDVLAWPYEFFYFMFFRGVAGDAPTAPIRRLNEALEREFLKKIPKMLTKSQFASQPLGRADLENLRAGPFDYPEFLTALHALEDREVDSLEYLFLLFECLQRSDAAYRDRPVKYFLVCTTARGIDWSCREILAGATFLFSAREMESSFTSVRDKYFRTKGINLCTFFSIFAKRSELYWMETFRRLSRAIEPVAKNENFILIPLKRLQSDRDALRKELCETLGIEATPSVFQLTLFGEPYYGNANQGDLNNGQIATQPSVTKVPLCSFEKRMFASLGLYDFDAGCLREPVPFAPGSAFRLACRGAFREMDREHVWGDPQSSPPKLLAGRLWILLNLCAIYLILRSESLSYRVVRKWNRRHVREIPIWKSTAERVRPAGSDREAPRTGARPRSDFPPR